LSSQGSTIGLIGENNELLYDFIVWQDLRGTDELNEIYEKFLPADEVYDLNGMPQGLVTSSYNKLLWVKKNMPEVWNKVKIFSTHQDYFLKVFGANGYYTDLSSASREGTFDVNNHCWSSELHEFLGIREDQRAVVCPDPGHIVGRINEDISAKTGLPVGCNICVGAHDQNCCTFGGGLVRGGEAVMVVGTFGSLFVASDTPVRDPNRKLVAKGNHGVGNWTLEAFSLTSASAFRWYRDVFCDLEVAAGRVSKNDPYDLITNQMKDVPIGSRGAVFLPFLQGLAGARPNSEARGTFLGMDLGTSKDQMARAVLEGICFEMYDILKAQQAAGITVDAIRLTGGAAKSPFWCQMFADIMDVPIQLLQTSETGCLGAALYAGIGSGIYKDCQDAVDKAVKLDKEFLPNPDNRSAYDEAFNRWNKAYNSLTGLGRFY
jgi:xylulokinase